MNPLKRLFSYTFRFKFSFLLSIFGFILFASADIAAVEWIRRIIEYINSNQDDFSIYLVLALIFIAIGRGAGFFIGNYFMSRVGFGIVHDLRSELFSKLINLPKNFFDQNQSGQLINRITFTTTQVSGAASNAIKTLVREGFLLVGLLVYMLTLNWKLTLLLLISVEIIGVLGKGATRWIRVFGLSIQPSELVKITIILSLAKFYHDIKFENIKKISYLFFPFLISSASTFAPATVGVPTSIILSSP